MEDRLLRAREVADRLQLPEQTLATWRHRREGPPWIKLGPRVVRYREAELKAWLDASAAGSPTSAA